MLANLRLRRGPGQRHIQTVGQIPVAGHFHALTTGLAKVLVIAGRVAADLIAGVDAVGRQIQAQVTPCQRDTQLNLPEHVGRHTACAQLVFGGIWRDGKALAPAATQFQPLQRLRANAQFGAGVADRRHALARRRRGLRALQITVAGEAIPAQAQAGHEQWVQLPLHLAESRQVVQAEATIQLRQADPLAVLGVFVLQVIGAFTIGLEAADPGQRPARQLAVAIEVEAAAEHIAVVSFFTLGPDTADRPGKPAAEVLVGVVDKTQQAHIVSQLVVGIQTQGFEVLLATVVLHVAVDAIGIMSVIGVGQIRGIVCLGLMQAGRQGHFQIGAHIQRPAPGQSLALSLRLIAKTIIMDRLHCQVKTLTLGLNAAGCLQVQLAELRCTDVQIAVVTAPAALQRDRAGPVVVAIQRRDRAAQYVDALQLQRNDHVQVAITIGVGHGLVERNTIDNKADVPAVPAGAKAAQRDIVGHSGQPKRADIHARHLAQQALHLINMLIANLVGVQTADRIGLISAIGHSLALDGDSGQRDRFRAGNGRQR